jgi:hypothetical protein
MHAQYLQIVTRPSWTPYSRVASSALAEQTGCKRNLATFTLQT